MTRSGFGLIPPVGRVDESLDPMPSEHGIGGIGGGGGGIDGGEKPYAAEPARLSSATRLTAILGRSDDLQRRVCAMRGMRDNRVRSHGCAHTH